VSFVYSYIYSYFLLSVYRSRRLLPQNENTLAAGTTLPSGIYLACPKSMKSRKAKEERIYVLYWPEEMTWNDCAIMSVRRNRVTFIRYFFPDYRDIFIY
jgi:hypothetical protein